MGMWVWLGIFVVFVIVEAATTELVSLWFCVGSLAGLVAAGVGTPMWTQIMFFVVTGFASLLILRPPLKKKLMPAISKTNLDRLAGMEAVVIEDVTAISGAVRADGKEWNARLHGAEAITAGEQCVVVELSGNKLLVGKAPVEKMREWQKED